MARSKSSARWLREHAKDPYVLRARREGYRSRATYKLKEINDRDRLLRMGMIVVDLGAAPGGWSQYVAREVGAQGLVVALDILDMQPLPGVTFLKGDFRVPSALDRLNAVLAARPVDLVISDMAPNSSGIKAVDQSRSMDLAELAVDFARHRLRPGGDLLVKIFQGPGVDSLLREVRAEFASLATRKPNSSRSRTPEIYMVARNYRPG